MRAGWRHAVCCRAACSRPARLPAAAQQHLPAAPPSGNPATHRCAPTRTLLSGTTLCGTAPCATWAMQMSWARRLRPGCLRAACRSGARSWAGLGARPGRVCEVCRRCATAIPPSACFFSTLYLRALAPHVPLPLISYAIAIGYVLFDTYDKWQKTLGDARAKLGSRGGIPASVDVDRWAQLHAALPCSALLCRARAASNRRRTAAAASALRSPRCPQPAPNQPIHPPRLATIIGAERGLDTLVWQLIASVAAPGFTIHQVLACLPACEWQSSGQVPAFLLLHRQGWGAGTVPW